MSLPGGSAGKLGNRYENWWTVLQLLRVLRGESNSIRIEAPGVEKAEFVMRVKEHLEFHQAKLKGQWTISLLGGKKHRLLQAIFKDLQKNNAQFFFVSTDGAPELRELAERARNAESLWEFERYYLESTIQQENFARLKSFWNCPSNEIAYDVLRRIYIKTIDEDNIRSLVSSEIALLFEGNISGIEHVLRCFTEDYIEQTITQDYVLTYLDKNGYRNFRSTLIKDYSIHQQLVKYYKKLNNEIYFTPSFFGDYKSIRLSDVYVPVQVNNSDLTSVFEALLKNRFNLLLGGIGSGKTSLVNYLVSVLAESQFYGNLHKDIPNEVRELLPSLPIRLAFSEIALNGVTVSDRPEDLIWEHLRLDLIAKLGSKVPIQDILDYLQEFSQDTGVFFLIDGLDDVTEFDNRRLTIIRALNHVAKKYPKCRILVTARSHIGDDQEHRLQYFTKLELMPFSNAKIHQFIEKLNQVIDTAKSDNNSLQACLKNYNGLAEFASTPLLLTVMANFHGYQGILPGDRAKFFAEIWNLLIDSWQRQRLGNAADSHSSSTYIRLENFHSEHGRIKLAMENLAFQVYYKQRDIEKPLISEGEMLVAIRPVLDSDCNCFRPTMLIEYL